FPESPTSFSEQLKLYREAFGLTQDLYPDGLPEPLQNVRLMGWRAFSPKPPRAPDPNWAGFPRAELYIPQLVLRREGSDILATLVCAPLEAELLWRRWQKKIAPPKPAGPPPIPTLTRADSRWLDRVSFCAGVEFIAEEPGVERVVLARRVAL